MSKFRIYNIQLLPDEDGIDEVGVAGYKRLFAGLRDENAAHLNSKTEMLYHYGLPGDTYLAPHDFRFPAGFVYGNFVRYTKTDELTELKTGKTLFKAGRKTAVASKKLIPFVFDTRRHYLAVDGAALPKGAIFVEALKRFLAPVAEKNFPSHELTVNLISKANALEDVFKRAVAYKTVDVALAFPNGHETEQLLRELKETKTQLNIHASGGVKGRMSAVPEFLKGLLRAAVVLGTAKISYFVAPEPGKDSTKKEVYNSEDTPVTFTVRHSAQDAGDQEFFSRVFDRLDKLDLDADDDEDDTE